jgi:hypothetical protein
MKDMSKSELIELVAATFFRVQAALSVLWALKDLLGSIPASYALYSMSSLSDSKPQVLNESIHRMILASFFGSVESLVTAMLLFFSSRSVSSSNFPRPFSSFGTKTRKLTLLFHVLHVPPV